MRRMIVLGGYDDIDRCLVETDELNDRVRATFYAGAEERDTMVLPRREAEEFGRAILDAVRDMAGLGPSGPDHPRDS